MTVDLAHQGGLVEGKDYTVGDPFGPNDIYHTARLIGDPVQLTIRVIDAVGYYTKGGSKRWDYIAIPKFIWSALEAPAKRDIIGFHYAHEGGITMRKLFPNFGKS